MDKLQFSSEQSTTIQNVQEQIHEWIQTVGVRYFSEMSNTVQLVEEVGELARLINRTYGEQSFKKGKEPENIKEELALEIADVFFVLMCIANQTGIDMTEAFQKSMNKKNTRDKNRHWENKKLTGEI